MDELKAVLLEDRWLQTVELEIINPGEACRAGYVFDIVEPRSKEPGIGVELADDAAEKYPFTGRPQNARLHLDGSVIDQ